MEVTGKLRAHDLTSRVPSKLDEEVRVVNAFRNAYCLFSKETDCRTHVLCVCEKVLRLLPFHHSIHHKHI